MKRLYIKSFLFSLAGVTVVAAAVLGFVFLPERANGVRPYAGYAAAYEGESEEAEVYAFEGLYEDEKGEGIVFVSQWTYAVQTTELTPREEHFALLQYFYNRLNAAAAYGANVRTGRHRPEDLEEFGNILRWATTAAFAAEEDEEFEALTRGLQAVIESFRDSLIDPYNRYRPFLETIARGEDVPQKYHLRAAWISTVINIDWPSVGARGTTPAHVDLQKYELRLRFEELAALNMNAVIFQISPTADAMFSSAMLPWSPWLTGETNFTGELLDSEGRPFSPLGYAIELAREFNMELHAWLNPYRITHRAISYTRGEGILLSSAGRNVANLLDIRRELELIPGNPFNTMGQHIREAEGWYVLEPGLPAARRWIVARVMEIVENYDVDAIHFDDYFYPSGWNDDVVFARYNTAENNWVSGIVHPNTPGGRADWRRENTEMLIREVNEAIKEAAPWVKFGVSPGGVWISGDGTTGLYGGGFTAGTGSGSTTSWSNFHSSFADTRRWVIENFIDYLTPQIYWDWSLAAAPYGAIADWWSRVIFDYGPDGALRNSQGQYTTTHLYIGIGLYRMAENPAVKWRNGVSYEYEGKRTFLRQEHYNLGNPNIHGSMIFTQNHLRPERGSGMWETSMHLRDNAWRYPALVPVMTHLGGTPPVAPVNVVVKNGVISWVNAEESDCQMVKPRYFVIYRSRLLPVDMANPANIYAIVPAVPGQVDYLRKLFIENYEEYHFLVTAVNRLHQESVIEVREQRLDDGE